jgi:hypothetical protein
MFKLSLWESFIIGAALSFLEALATQVKNQTELAAIQAAVTFLQKLLNGQVSTT